MRMLPKVYPLLRYSVLTWSYWAVVSTKEIRQCIFHKWNFIVVFAWQQTWPYHFFGYWGQVWVVTSSPSNNIIQSWFQIQGQTFWHYLCATKDHHLTPAAHFPGNIHGLGAEGGKPRGEGAPMPSAAAISGWGGFGAGANSSQAHGPFTTPRHEQIEKHSPFPAPYMEQISV